MDKIKFKTLSSTSISDTVTPVGLYLRFRDKYANTLLLESSDYHSKEESYSFICIEPLVSMKVESHLFSAVQKGTTVFKEEVEGNFYQLFSKFSESIAQSEEKTELVTKMRKSFFSKYYNFDTYSFNLLEKL